MFAIKNKYVNNIYLFLTLYFLNQTKKYPIIPDMINNCAVEYNIVPILLLFNAFPILIKNPTNIEYKTGW